MNVHGIYHHLLLIALASCPLLTAQAMHIGYLYPAGARQGTLVEVLVGGQGPLWSIYDVRVTGGGVTCEGIEGAPYFPYPFGKQHGYIVACLKARLENRPMPAKPESLEGWRPNPYYDAIADLSPRAFELAIREFFVRIDQLQKNPSIQQKLLVRLRIAPDAKPGRRELRLVRRNIGEVTNPLPFFISALPEVCEEPYRMPPAKAPPTAFTAPCVLNGQIFPGESDRFTFTAKKGEFLSFRSIARGLYPFQGDCVPGHAQLVLEIFDANGRSVAYADDDAFRPDPVLEHRFAKDGKYTLVVRDALYRGRDDFAYRVEVVRTPRRRVMPLPPRNTLPVAAAAKAPAVIRSPLLISGHLAAKEQRTFRFAAEKDRPLAIEVWARRLGSPLDPVLTIRDAQGKVLHQVDDTPRLLIGDNLQRSADPYCRFVPPATGEYTATVSDLVGTGGKNAFYHLRIDRLRPDFNLYVAPSYLSVSSGCWSNYLVRVEPVDGFCDEIHLSVEGESAKFFQVGAVDTLPAGAGSVWIALRPKVHWTKQRSVVPLQLVGRSGKLKHMVIPCHSDMQAFAYTHWLPVEELLGGIYWPPYWQEGFRWSADTPFKFSLKPGGSVILRSVMTRPAPQSGFRKLKLTCQNPRNDLKIEEVQGGSSAPAVRITLLPPDDKTAALPRSENLLFQLTGEYDDPPDRKGKVNTKNVSFQLEVVQLKIVP